MPDDSSSDLIMCPYCTGMGLFLSLKFLFFLIISLCRNTILPAGWQADKECRLLESWMTFYGDSCFKDIMNAEMDKANIMEETCDFAMEELKEELIAQLKETADKFDRYCTAFFTDDSDQDCLQEDVKNNEGRLTPECLVNGYWTISFPEILFEKCPDCLEYFSAWELYEIKCVLNGCYALSFQESAYPFHITMKQLVNDFINEEMPGELTTHFEDLLSAFEKIDISGRKNRNDNFSSDQYWEREKATSVKGVNPGDVKADPLEIGVCEVHLFTFPGTELKIGKHEYISTFLSDSLLVKTDFNPWKIMNGDFSEVKDDFAEQNYMFDPDQEEYQYNDILHDYRFKQSVIYDYVVSEGKSIERRKRLASDFVKMTDDLGKRKYRINGKLDDFKSLIRNDIVHNEELVKLFNEEYADNREAGDRENAGLSTLTEKIFYTRFSIPSCRLYFYAFCFNKNDEMLMSFLRQADTVVLEAVSQDIHYSYRTFFDQYKCRQKYDSRALVNDIHEMTEKFYEKCMHDNSAYGFRLNSIPRYCNNLENVPVLIRNFRNEYISQTVDVPRHIDEILSQEFVKMRASLLSACRTDEEKTSVEQWIEKEKENGMAGQSADKCEKWQEAVRVYDELYLLGEILQVLYMVDDVISVSDQFGSEESFEDDIYEIRKLIFDPSRKKTADQTYRQESNANISEKIEREQKETYERIISQLNALMDRDSSMEEIQGIRRSIVQEATDADLEDDRIEMLCKNILSLIEDKAAGQKELQAVKKKIEDELNEKFSCVEKKIKPLLEMTQSTEQIDKYKNNILRYLTTAEFLYQKYIRSDLKLINDYSCIALEYYRSLEALANLSLYMPYRGVLRRYHLLENISKSDFECANAGANNPSRTCMYNKSKDKYTWKETLEIGTMGYLFRRYETNKETEQTLKQEKGNYQYVDEMCCDMKIPSKRLNKVAKQLVRVAGDRNAAAHADRTLFQSDAVKARIETVNDDDAYKIHTVCSCRKLIMQIFDLFS